MSNKSKIWTLFRTWLCKHRRSMPVCQLSSVRYKRGKLTSLVMIWGTISLLETSDFVSSATLTPSSVNLDSSCFILVFSTSFSSCSCSTCNLGGRCYHPWFLSKLHDNFRSNLQQFETIRVIIGSVVQIWELHVLCYSFQFQKITWDDSHLLSGVSGD